MSRCVNVQPILIDFRIMLSPYVTVLDKEMNILKTKNGRKVDSDPSWCGHDKDWNIS